MPTNYPGAIDSLNNPASGELLTSPRHDLQHVDVNDAIEAIETELGTDPSGSYADVSARLAKFVDISGRPTGTVFYINSDGTPIFLEPGGNGGKFLRFNAAENALEAAVAGLITAEAFEWQTKIAQRYVAKFSGDQFTGNTVYGDLADVGWHIGAGMGGSSPGIAMAGDLDASSDPSVDGITLGSTSTAFGSPPIVGSDPMLDMLDAVTGTRPTTITAWVSFAMTSTTDHADTTGVGLCHDGDALPGAGALGIWIANGATNFEILTTTTAADTGVAKDLSAHLLEVIIDVAAATYSVKLDGTEVKAAAAVTQDQFPLRMHGGRTTTGDTIRIYGWGVNYD